MFGKKRLIQDNEELSKEVKALRERITSLTASYDGKVKIIKDLKEQIAVLKLNPYKPTLGYTVEEVSSCINAIDDLIKEAGIGHKKPTEQMKGLAAACAIIKQLTPHELN